MFRAAAGTFLCALLFLGGCGNPAEPVAVDQLPAADPAAIPPAPRLALVLSSGGPRGFAHLGVLKVLHDAVIHPDLIVGSSSGALVGVLYAAGLTPAEIEVRALALDGIDVFDYDIVRRRVPGSALQRWVNGQVGRRPLEQLPLHVAVVATRAADGRSVAFTRGDAGAAVRASSASPSNFAPVDIGGVVYVDGDVAAPLPIVIARAFGAQRVIAVDVAQDVGRAPAPEGAPASWTTEAIARREVIKRESTGADVLIAPELPYITGFSVEYRRMAIATGEAAARAALPRLRELLRR